MISELAELIKAYEQGAWSRADYFHRITLLAPRFPTSVLMEELPISHRDDFVRWLRETYENDVPPEEFVSIGPQGDAALARERIDSLRCWLRANPRADGQQPELRRVARWVPAHGEHQLHFLGAASRALQGDLRPCPKCNAGLRAYYHVTNPERGTGILWAWCGTCGMHAALPRVKPTVRFPDPFADASREEFVGLELSTEELFFDRLERLWNDGTLHRP